MSAETSSSEPGDPSPNPIVRILDAVVVAIIKLLIVLANLKSRDPRERSANLLKPDPRQQTRIRNWEGVLDWSPQKRVGCFAGVVIGIALGGTILWYSLH